MDLAGKRVLVNNAGVGDTAPIEEMTVEAWIHTLNVNLRDT